jgi:hypothetical protein
MEPDRQNRVFHRQNTDAGEQEISLLLPKDKSIVIPYKNISKARLEVEI